MKMSQIINLFFESIQGLIISMFRSLSFKKYLASQNDMNILDSDSLLCVFEFLNKKSIRVCQLVNKQFYKVTTSDFIWNKFFVRKFTGPITSNYHANYNEFNKLDKYLNYFFKENINCAFKHTYLTTLPPHRLLPIYIPQEIGILTHLTRMIFDNCYIDSIPSEIGKLTNLEFLSVCKNRLKTIPLEIGNLINLKELQLYSNWISYIPPEISLLTNLNELKLYNNHLESIPVEICHLHNLKTLGLSNNRFRSIPPEIGLLTNLRELDLDHNRYQILPEEMYSLTNLEVLSLLTRSLKTIPDELNSLTKMRRLVLEFSYGGYIPEELLSKSVRAGLHPSIPI
jgi:hypothetical protein